MTAGTVRRPWVQIARVAQKGHRLLWRPTLHFYVIPAVVILSLSAPRFTRSPRSTKRRLLSRLVIDEAR